MRLVLASNNASKLRELRALLGSAAVVLVAQRELGIAEAEEPHITFIENALAKARHAAAACGGAAIADDSGLCVDALGGQPGVASAHYAPAPGAATHHAPAPGAATHHAPAPGAAAHQAPAPGAATHDAPAPDAAAHDASIAPVPGAREARRQAQDAANNALLLHKLQGMADRRAHFISTLVAVRHAQDPQPLVAVGRWPGTIALAAQGEHGFGYDPLLWLDHLGCTAAELDPAHKNAISHRALAAQQMRALLRDVWQL